MKQKVLIGATLSVAILLLTVVATRRYVSTTEALLVERAQVVYEAVSGGGSGEKPSFIHDGAWVKLRLLDSERGPVSKYRVLSANAWMPYRSVLVETTRNGTVAREVLLTHGLVFEDVQEFSAPRKR